MTIILRVSLSLNLKDFNSYGAIRYLGGSLARYILRAPKYLKTCSIVYFGPLYLDN